MVTKVELGACTAMPGLGTDATLHIETSSSQVVPLPDISRPQPSSPKPPSVLAAVTGVGLSTGLASPKSGQHAYESRSPLSAMGSGPPPECGDATPSATATATGYFSEPGSQADTRSSRSTSVPVASSSAHLQPSTANAHAATTAAPSGSSPVQGLGGRGLSRRGGQDVGPSGRASAASSSPGKGSGAAAAPGMVRLPPGPVVRRGPAGFTGVPTRSRSPGAEGSPPSASRRPVAPMLSASTPIPAAAASPHPAATPTPGPAPAPAPGSLAHALVDVHVPPFRPGTSSVRPVFAKYTWDADYQRALIDAAMRLPPEAVPAGFITTLSSQLPSHDTSPPMEPDPTALRWFKDSYPDAVSTTRRDAIAVRLWVEQQMALLRSHLDAQQQPRPHSAPYGTLAPAAAWMGAGAGVVNGGGTENAPTSPRRTGGGAGGAGVQERGKSISGGPGQGGQLQAGAAGGGAGVGGAGGAGALPHFAGADSLVLVRDAEGYLDAAVLRHQETLLSRCMTELAGQVATLCVERGHMLALVWGALRHVLHAVLADRDTARTTAATARRMAAQAAQDKAEALSRIESEKADMDRMNELLNRRLLGAKMEAEHVRTRHQDVEAELARLRAVQPDELRKEVDALRVQVSALERQYAAAQTRLERCQADLAERDKELAAAVAKMASTSEELVTMREDYAQRSPRPCQPRMPPWELMSGEESAVALQGLRAGVPAQDMHRLLLGVSSTGANVLPWCHLLGCCRHLDPNAPPSRLHAAVPEGGPPGGAPGQPADGEQSVDTSPARLRGGKQGRLTAPSAVDDAPSAPASRGATAAAAASRRTTRSTSVKPSHTDLASALQGALGGAGAISGGGGERGGGGGRGFNGAQGSGSRRTTLVSLVPPEPPSIKEQHTWLHGLLSRPDAATALARWLPDEVVEAVAQMANHSIDPHSIACLLLGTVSVAGADVVPYRSLAGLLTTRYHHTAADIGGSITEALELAAMSTRNRVERLQEINKNLHREVVRTKRNLAALRKVERDDRMTELRNVARKVQGRRPSPLQDFMLQKRPEYFMGLGTGDEVPAVMQAEGKLYNRAMEKADAERLVHAVWHSKRDFEAAHGVRITLPDYLAVYLQRKYGAAKAAAEAAYNLVYTLGQHQYDPDCYLVVKILMGDLDDSAREGQERLRTAVLDALLAADSAANSGRVTGWLRKADMRDVLRGLLGAEAVAQQQKQRAAELAEAATAGAGAGVGGGGKAGGRASGAGEAQGAGAGAGGGGRAGGRTSGAGEAQAAGAGAEAAGGRECSGWLAVGLSGQQLDDLFDALDSEEPHEMVQYARLFEDDPDLNQGVFVETLRQQHLHNRMEWLQSIEDAVLDWAEASGSSTVGPTALRNALLKAHPTADPATQRELLVRVYGSAGAGVVLQPGEKGGKAAAKGGKGDVAPALPLETALRKLRQEHAEGMCSISQAMDLMSAGRAARGNRNTTSPRRVARGSQGGQQQQQQQQLGPGGEGGAGGRAGGGIMWADGAGDGVGLTLIEDDLEGV